MEITDTPQVSKEQRIDPADFLIKLYQVLGKTKPKINAFLMQGAFNAGKTFWMCALTPFKDRVGYTVQSQDFSFEKCVNKSVIMIQELTLVKPESIEEFKKICEGNQCLVNVKHKEGKQLKRTPVLITWNFPPWQPCMKEKDAISNRMYMFQNLMTTQCLQYSYSPNPSFFGTMFKYIRDEIGEDTNLSNDEDEDWNDYCVELNKYMNYIKHSEDVTLSDLLINTPVTYGAVELPPTKRMEMVNMDHLLMKSDNKIISEMIKYLQVISLEAEDFYWNFEQYQHPVLYYHGEELLPYEELTFSEVMYIKNSYDHMNILRFKMQHFPTMITDEAHALKPMMHVCISHMAEALRNFIGTLKLKKPSSTLETITMESCTVTPVPMVHTHVRDIPSPREIPLIIAENVIEKNRKRKSRFEPIQEEPLDLSLPKDEVDGISSAMKALANTLICCNNTVEIDLPDQPSENAMQSPQVRRALQMDSPIVRKKRKYNKTHAKWKKTKPMVESEDEVDFTPWDMQHGGGEEEMYTAIKVLPELDVIEVESYFEDMEKVAQDDSFSEKMELETINEADTKEEFDDDHITEEEYQEMLKPDQDNNKNDTSLFGKISGMRWDNTLQYEIENPLHHVLYDLYMDQHSIVNNKKKMHCIDAYMKKEAFKQLEDYQQVKYKLLKQICKCMDNLYTLAEPFDHIVQDWYLVEFNYIETCLLDNDYQNSMKYFVELQQKLKKYNLHEIRNTCKPK